MTLAEGTRLGPYEIAVALGAGEIGEEAYRAQGIRLDRAVAIAQNMDRIRVPDSQQLAAFWCNPSRWTRPQAPEISTCCDMLHLGAAIQDGF